MSGHASAAQQPHCGRQSWSTMRRTCLCFQESVCVGLLHFYLSAALRAIRNQPTYMAASPPPCVTCGSSLVFSPTYSQPLSRISEILSRVIPPGGFCTLEENVQLTLKNVCDIKIGIPRLPISKTFDVSFAMFPKKSIERLRGFVNNSPHGHHHKDL